MMPDQNASEHLRKHKTLTKTLFNTMSKETVVEYQVKPTSCHWEALLLHVVSSTSLSWLSMVKETKTIKIKPSICHKSPTSLYRVHLYRDCQRWRKPNYHAKTIDLSQVTDMFVSSTPLLLTIDGNDLCWLHR
jgi:hypothetical protein